MGVTWHSEAEIVSLEPDAVKDIIEKIVEKENVTEVYDLKIKGNSIFFHSFNYGYYSADFGNGETLLFEKVFEQYNGALIAFEYVVYCVDHSYMFNSVWVKPEGNVDWEDEETFHKCLCCVEEEGELTHNDSFNTEEDIFDYSWRWNISLASLKAVKKQLPALFALVQAAEADGFDGWMRLENDSNNYVTYDVVCTLMDEYWDESGDNELAPFDDIKWDMIRWVKDTEIGMEDLQFELPDNFPKLQTQPSNIREGKFFSRET